MGGKLHTWEIKIWYQNWFPNCFQWVIIIKSKFKDINRATYWVLIHA